MTVSEFEVVLKKCKEIGVTQVTLSGGEPTEHPDFHHIMELACADFDVHVATHGDWKEDFASQMMIQGVSQVQFNYQGSKRHDRIHGVDRSYNAQLMAIEDVKGVGIDVVATVTVGAFNITEVNNIFKELDDLGVTRLRVWEATGYGNQFRKGLSARDIFDICADEAKELGYKYIQSYDPEFAGDVGVPCPSLSKLYMYVKADSTLSYCGVVPLLRDTPIADFKIDSAPDILNKYISFVESMKSDKPYCAARSDKQYVNLKKTKRRMNLVTEKL